MRSSPSSKVTLAPSARSMSTMVNTSAMRGTRRMVDGSAASKLAAMSLRAEFLAPARVISPVSLWPPRTSSERGGPGSAPSDTSNESSEAAWQAREELFETKGRLVLKVSLLPVDVCPVSLELQQWAAREKIEIDLVSQATGLMTVALSGSLEKAIALIEHLRARLRGSGGSVIALRIPEPLRAGLEPWGCDSNALPLMREIKRRFDPNRILNPGRFVGNI